MALVLVAAGSIAPTVVGSAVAAPGSSCDARQWPSTPVTCAEAQRSASLGMSQVTATRIWLTTLVAVDEAFGPRQQVADHPTDPNTPVWVFVYDGHRPGILYENESGELVRSPDEQRVLHVADATNPATREGAFVYLFGWSELDSPELRSRMPEVAGS